MSDDRRRIADTLTRRNRGLAADFRTFSKALHSEQGEDTIALSAEGRAALTRIRAFYDGLRQSLAGTPGSADAVDALTRMDEAFDQAEQVLDAQAAFPADLAQRSVRNARRAAADLAKAAR